MGIAIGIYIIYGLTIFVSIHACHCIIYYILLPRTFHTHRCQPYSYIAIMTTWLRPSTNATTSSLALLAANSQQSKDSSEARTPCIALQLLKTSDSE